MMIKAGTVGAVSLGTVLLAVAAVSAQTHADYRDFVLGSSVARVMEQTQAAASDLTRVHERPELIQQLEWRPYFSNTFTGGFRLVVTSQRLHAALAARQAQR